MEKIRVFLYCRVAHDDSICLTAQAAELRCYAKQAGYIIVGVAAEQGSGLTLDRPALQEVMRAVLGGEVDVVLVQSITRIGREWGMTQRHMDLLSEHKVKLLCVKAGLTISNKNLYPYFGHKKAECP